MNYQVKSRIWLMLDGKVFLGEGRVRLLKAIVKMGSLSKAAISLNMSYKKAWNLVSVMNKSGLEPVVVSKTGGSGGGGTVVSEYGQKMIQSFEELNEKCWVFLDEKALELKI